MDSRHETIKGLGTQNKLWHRTDSNHRMDWKHEVNCFRIPSLHKPRVYSENITGEGGGGLNST